MVRKEECTKAIQSFRAKHGLEASDENLIAALHLMNEHGLDVHGATDQSSRAPKDKGIDAWFYDERLRELFVYQSKLSESKTLVLRGFGDLSRARDWLEAIVVGGEVDSVVDNPSLFNLYSKVAAVREELQAIHFKLLSAFEETELEDSPEYKDFERETVQSQLNRSMGDGRRGHLNIGAERYNLRPGVARIVKAYAIEKILDSRLNLRGNGGGSGGSCSYLDLAYIPLHSLVMLYRQRGDVLFDKNVRMSLAGSKEGRERLVNPMNETLDQITSGQLSPAIFGFYHIGVTIAAASAAPDGTNVVCLEAPSIINGCQTITTANEYLKRLEKQNDAGALVRFKAIQVIAKVVVGVSNSELKEITNCNNRQNPIENWQLFSNEPVHIEIEAALKEHGVFYERQKGRFDTVIKKADDGMHYPKTNATCIKVVDLAQVIALARGHTQMAGKPSDIFINKESHDKIFDAGIPCYVRDIVFTTNLFKAVKRGLNKYLELPTHANSSAPQIFRKTAVRTHVYQLALLYAYQRKNWRSLRLEFSTSLVKIANPRLVSECQAFFQGVVNRVKKWYTETSRDLTVEVSNKRTDAFFVNLATELGVDLEGATPFADRSIDWDAEAEGPREGRRSFGAAV